MSRKYLSLRLMILALMPVPLIGISACGAAPQPESAKTVAAFEVPLPSQADRDQFLAVLRNAAANEGMHVDAVSTEDLKQQAKVSAAFEMTMNATVWKDANDDEPIASAMDQPGHLGQVWIFFSKGEDVMLNSRLREAVMREIMRNWPETLSLPIMPTGAIPLHRDLIRTPEGYVVNPAEAHRYELHNEEGRSR
jgi:hypothetical protein